KTPRQKGVFVVSARISGRPTAPLLSFPPLLKELTLCPREQRFGLRSRRIGRCSETSLRPPPRSHPTRPRRPSSRRRAEGEARNHQALPRLLARAQSARL